jgi:hypothetical protein
MASWGSSCLNVSQSGKAQFACPRAPGMTNPTP